MPRPLAKLENWVVRGHKVIRTMDERTKVSTYKIVPMDEANASKTADGLTWAVEELFGDRKVDEDEDGPL